MTEAPAARRGDAAVDRRGRSLVQLTVASALLLVTIVALASSVVMQTRDLRANVQITEGIIDANVRTIGQVQRELLRVAAALEPASVDVDDLEMKRAFVSQRMREVSLSYQLQTLGTEELLAEARALGRRWFSDVDPAIRRVVAGGGGPDLAEEALVTVREIELGFNDLGAQGEINRKLQSGRANDATVAMLDRTRLLAVGLWGTFVGFLVVVTVFVRRFRRFERNREEINRRLIDLNDELRSLSEVANRTGNLVVITDVRGRIEWVNEAFELRTGYTLEEACGRTPGALLQGPETDPRTVEDMRAKIHAGQPFISEILNYTRAGAAYWVRLDVRPVVDADGILTGFVAVQTDVTEQREAQDLLRRAKEEAERAAEQKSQFLATMSHEIRTPLNAVIGLTDLLLDTDLDARQHEYAATARNSGTLLLETINDILCFSAVEAGGLQLECRDFDVRALAGGVGGVLAPQALEAGLRFAVRVEDRVPEALRGDEVRLRQVLVNVIANAIKFTETGGIDVVVDASPLGGGRHRVTIAVHDTGIGIPAAVLPSLFDPFTQGDASTTRRYGGSGLGLAITHRIIDVMGGEIDIESVVGAGTRFVVSVDLAEGQLEPERVEVAAIDLSPTRRLRILVAEDDPVNQMVIERMLERLGHDTTVVSEGAQAVAAALRSDYDVVLMDVQMPGVDGVDAMRRIRGELPAARQPQIVALTANALDGDRERLIAQGMDDYLSKPVQLAALRDMLANSTNTQMRATPGAVHHAVRADP